MLLSNFFEKIKIFFTAIKLLENWYLYPLVYFKLIKQNHIIFKTKTGLKIRIRVNSTDLMAFTHVWLIQEYSAPKFKINNNDLILDIGAHIGLFSLFASQFCKNGKIFCYEPIKENYNELLQNIKINNIKNIFPFNCAVSNKTEKIKIYLNDDESGHSIFLENSNYVEVDSISINDIFENHSITKCNFLKLDCEGAEYEIIELLSKKHLGKIEKSVIEYHMFDKYPHLLKELQNTLEKNSFKLKTRSLFLDIGFLFALKK